METRGHRILKIDDVILDLDGVEMRRGDEIVKVEPKVFDLIAYLASQAGRLVSRDEIISEVWQGRVVSDSAISTQIHSARRALADDGNAQRFIKTVHGRGYRFEIRPQLLDQSSRNDDKVDSKNSIESSQADHRIGIRNQAAVRYCMSRDGTSIAHTHVGSGYPLIFTGSWITHLEQEWQNPAWAPYFSHLARYFTVIRYDQRGNGMSDWVDVEIAFDRMVEDLERVIDCYDLDKVAVFGGSQGAAVSIAFVHKFPNKVSHLILYGGYSRGRRRRGDPAAEAESHALETLIRLNWGGENPGIRQQMTAMFMPEATQEEAAWFNEFQKACGPAENIARFREVFDEIDVSPLLESLSVPTLIVHSLGDAVAPISEAKLFASRIPGAQFVMLNSNNHMILENDPEFPKFVSSIVNFIQ